MRLDEPLFRPPVPTDVESIARLHAESWRRTYHGILRVEWCENPGGGNAQNLRNIWASPGLLLQWAAAILADASR